MRIAVLFDGGGLARLGLEEAGHDCIGFELDPNKHRLSLSVGSGQCELADVRDVDLRDFEGVWASPPCQWLSSARSEGPPRSKYATNLLDWALALPHTPLWVENVYNPRERIFGSVWNAAQFATKYFQNRVRIIGGRYKTPFAYREYKRYYPDAIPTISATEFYGSRTDKRRASRIFGRRLSLDEVAMYQGFDIPSSWRVENQELIYEAIGNGVPVYMAKAFGEAYQ